MAEWRSYESYLLNSTSGSSAAFGGGLGEERPVGTNRSLGQFYPNKSPLEDDIWFKAFAIVSYSLVFVASVFGNLLVIVVILCHKQMRSAVNFFLCNLAVADLFVGIFCVLPVLFKYISQSWWLGRVICKMHNFVQLVNYTCSIIILTVISIERYIIISHPLWNRCFSGGWRIRSTVVCLVWLASITYSIPMLLTYDTLAAPAVANQTVYYCARSKSVITYETYAMVDMTVLYAVPLLLMTFVYVRISIILWKSSKVEVRTQFVSDDVIRAQQTTPSIGSTWRARCKRPLVWCSRGCRGSLERGQSPWQESTALKIDRQDEDLKKTENRSGATRPTTAFSSQLLPDGPHNEWTIEVPMRQMEPCLETGNRLPKDALTPSSQSSSSSSSTVTPPTAAAAAVTRTSPCQPYQLRRLRTIQKPQLLHHSLLSDSTNQTPLQARHLQQQHQHQHQSGRPIVATVHKNGRLKHAVVVSTTTASTSTAGSDCRTPSKVPLALQRRRRVIRLLIAIIVSFAVCTLPNHVRILYYIVTPHPYISYGQMYVPPITMLLFYMNSAINPILYAFISRKFRRAVVTLDWRYLWRKLVRGEASSSERYTLN